MKPAAPSTIKNKYPRTLARKSKSTEALGSTTASRPLLQTGTVHKTKYISTSTCLKSVRSEMPANDKINFAYHGYLVACFEEKILKSNKALKSINMNFTLSRLLEIYQKTSEYAVRLQMEVAVLESYGNWLESLTRFNNEVDQVAKILSESDFVLMLQTLNTTLEEFFNKLQLEGIKEDEIDFCFKTNLLGNNSDISKHLNELDKLMNKLESEVSFLAVSLNKIQPLTVFCESLNIKFWDDLNKQLDVRMENCADQLYKLAFSAYLNEST